jgi:hypothetical protein
VGKSKIQIFVVFFVLFVFFVLSHPKTDRRHVFITVCETKEHFVYKDTYSYRTPLTRIRKKCNKKDDEYVSIDDFIKATGLNEWDVQRALDMLTGAGSASIIIN